MKLEASGMSSGMSHDTQLEFLDNTNFDTRSLWYNIHELEE